VSKRFQRDLKCMMCVYSDIEISGDIYCTYTGLKEFRDDGVLKKCKNGKWYKEAEGDI